MRILHAITSLDPNEGGPPVVVERLAAAQASLGHDVEILAYLSGAAHERFRKAVAAIPGFDRVKPNILPLHPHLSSEWIGTVARKWIKENLAQYDMFHLHGVWNALLLQVAAQARRLNKPYCVVPHGMLDPWCLWGQSWKSATVKAIGLAVLYKRFLNRAAFVHVLNADEANLMKPLALTSPTVVLPNGVFLSEMSPLPSAGQFRAAHPEIGSDPYVLFLSRLHFKKGLDFLVDAFASIAGTHPTLRLVIAGPDDGMVEPIRQQAAARRVDSRVHLIGPIYGQDKLAAFVDCACFCLPSRQEGFSMAITEALVCGKPVVISDQCHFPEVAETNAGFVVPCGASPTAEALSKALSLSADQAAAMGERGRELVTTRFTWPSIAERTIEAYRRFGGVQ